MELKRLGKLSFVVRPIVGKEFNILVYVNHSKDSKIIEFDCQYTPLSDKDSNYFIRSIYQVSEVSRVQGRPGEWHVNNTLVLSGSIKDRCSINVMHRVSSDIERVLELLNKTITMMKEDPKSFKSSLSWHARSMRHDDITMRQALCERGFIVSIEIIALFLLAERHPDPAIGKLGNQVIGQAFTDGVAIGL